VTKLNLRLLGTFQATHGDTSLDGFRSDKVRALLAYLAIEGGRPQRRETLQSLLWGEYPKASAQASLRSALSNLRKVLRAADARSLLTSTRASVTLHNDESQCWVDIAEFDALALAHQTHLHQGVVHCATCLRRMRRMAALYQGDFLAGLTLPDAPAFDEWRLLQQEARQRQMTEALSALIAHYSALGEHEQAVRYARRQLKLSPWRESAHRQLMEELALSGQRNAALAHYNVCRQTLRHELGVEPSPETTALYEQIRAREIGWDVEAEGELPNPYKGLQPFQETDAQVFFGREALVSRLFERLNETLDEDPWITRFLVVVGPSGSGKSSVVRAGLLPVLHKASRQGRRLHVVTMLPGDDPRSELRAALDEALPPDASTSSPPSEDQPLVQMLEERVPKGDCLFLIIDQAEELLTLTQDEEVRADFLADLLAALRVPDSCLHLVVTLRADHYAHPLQSPEWGKLVTQRVEFTLPLSPQEMRRAIEEPARRAGVQLEPELVSTLIADAGQEAGALPLLQYTLTELFEQRTGRTMTLASYREMGGLTGALVGRVEELYDGLTELERSMAQQLFLRLVVLRPDAAATRRRVSRAELLSLAEGHRTSETVEAGTQQERRETLESVMGLFGRHRLLTFDRDPAGGEATVEIAHEALIVAWDRLRDWIQAQREGLHLRRRLHALVQAWERSGRDPSFLARGRQLEQLRDWSATTDLTLLDGELAYLQSSLAAWQAETTREAAMARRSRNRLRALVAVLTVAVLISGALGVFAFHQQRIAEREAAVAQSLNLATSAQLALSEHDTDLALALALAANRLPDPPPQARLTLADAAYMPGTRRVFEGHEGPIAGLAISDDGRTAISASADATLILWDLDTGEVIRRFTGHEGPVHNVALHPAGDRALSASADGALILWDLDSGQALRRFDGHTGEVRSVAISPDGKRALSGSADHTLILWDLESGQVLRRFTGHSGEVLDVAISPDGKRAMSGSADHSLILWELSSGKVIHHFVGQSDTLEGTYDPQGHFGPVWGVAFSPDGQRAVSVAYDEYTLVWDLTTGEWLARFRPPALAAHLYGLAVSPDGRTALIGTLDNRVALLDLAEGKTRLELHGHSGRVLSVAFTPDGRRALSGSSDGTLRLWDLHSGAELQRLSGTLLGPGLDISPDGTTGLAATWDGAIWLWEYESGEMTRALKGHTEMLFAGAYFTPDGERIVSGSGDFLSVSDDNTVRVWDVATSDEIWRFEEHTDHVWDVAVSPSGRYAASGSHDGTLRLWDLETGEGRALLNVAPQAVRSVAFGPACANPSNRTKSSVPCYLLVGLAKGQSSRPDYGLRLLEVPSGEEVRRFEGHEEVVHDVAFRSDGELALSASADQQVILWETATGEIRHRLSGHAGSPLTVAFSPDGDLVASAGQDQTVFLWDVETGLLLRRFAGHRELILEVAFAPDGQSIWSVSDDDTVRQWEVNASQDALLSWTAVNRHVPELTCEQRVRYTVPPLCE
jgi:WD40 repeat protein/DNA-binding SARP family transcriptional activator